MAATTTAKGAATAAPLAAWVQEYLTVDGKHLFSGIGQGIGDFGEYLAGRIAAHEGSVVDAAPKNGPYDLCIDGARVEVKTSRLLIHHVNGAKFYAFHGLDPDKFDVAWLLGLGDDRVHLYRLSATQLPLVTRPTAGHGRGGHQCGWAPHSKRVAHYLTTIIDEGTA